MGAYLNPGNEEFAAVRRSKYVDKSGLISEMNRTLGSMNSLICVSRPRRFGKSFAAKMLCAYYDRSCDSSGLFDDLAVASDETYLQHRNQYNVIYVDITGASTASDRYRELIPWLKERITAEITEEFPGVSDRGELLFTLLSAVEAAGTKFIMIIDEWDAPIRENPSMTMPYLEFLRSLFKNSGMTSRVFAGVYMTGILPITKAKSQSALSDFTEYTMLAPRRFTPYVGFSEPEVKALCADCQMDFSKMKFWYDGYMFKRLKSVYNPNSVMQAIKNDEFDSYWKQTSAADNLLHLIDHDFDGLQKSIAELLGGVNVPVDTSSFQNDMHAVHSRDDALTLLIHLGYLAYDDETETAHIPNEEIRLEFSKMIRRVSRAETIERVRESDQLIEDTIAQNEDAVAAQIEKIHAEETAPLFYNNEQSLRSAIKLAYFSYKDAYLKFEELPSGNGYADIVYFPKKNSPYPALLIELKWDASADSAIAQIKDRRYPAALLNYGGELLLVGISYDRDSKGDRTHHCKIEPFHLPASP